MTTAMEGGTGVAITAIKNGVAITMGIEGTDLDISNPIITHNLSMFRRQCTIRRNNRPASVCFYRLIFVGKYRLKRAHVSAMD